MAEFTHWEIYMLLNQKNSGLWLAGIDLSEANLSGVNLTGANLNHANLTNANLSKASLVGANLNGANLSGAILHEANLNGASLFETTLTGTDLSAAYMGGANLQRSTSPEGNWAVDQPKPSTSPPAPLQKTPTKSTQKYPITSPQGVNVIVQKEESVWFAVVTLLLYIFLYPVGLLLNIVGLITGPQRGCFWTLLMVFVVGPILITLILTALGVPIIETILESLSNLP